MRGDDAISAPGSGGNRRPTDAPGPPGPRRRARPVGRCCGPGPLLPRAGFLPRSIAAAAALQLAAAAGCGAPSGPPVLEPGRAWDASLVDLFDDAVDWITPLRALLGTPWFEEYGARLARRLEEADVVAVVRLKATLPPGGAQAAGALEVEVLQSLVGRAVPGMTVRLDVPPAAAGRLDAESVRIEEQGRFVAFIRLYRGETGDVRNHWHLSPFDQDLVNTIRRTTPR